MIQVLRFAILGLGAGAVYALLGQGIVLIYRGSGVVNFAQGAMAMVGTYIWWDLRTHHGWPFWAAAIVGVGAVAIFGALIHLVIMRPLVKSAPLVRIVATLGFVSILTAGAQLYWGAEQRIVDASLPRDLWYVGELKFTTDRILLAFIAVLITAVIWAVYRFTRFGLAVVAASEDETSAAALGWSPDFLAAVNWAAGGALAALAGILVVPLTGLQVNTLTLIVITALAAALLGGFSSFWLTLVGGLALGIAGSLSTRYVKITGFNEAIPFLVITLVLIVRGKALPLRSHVLQKLPRLGPDRISWKWLGVPVVIGVLGLTVFGPSWNNAFNTSVTMAVVLLSVVVLTGFTGQISLAQAAMAGLGALIAGRLVAGAGWPFELALVAGVVGAMVIGLIFALPALRTRGINLAVVTLGLGLAVQSVVFLNYKYTGGLYGTQVGEAKFFGINIDRLDHGGRYLVFAMTWLVLAIIVVLNVRRGRAGRRLISVRTNERAAASLGVSVFGAKLYGFALSAGIAGLGGTLIAFQDHSILYDRFSPFESINIVLLAVLGGVGYVVGSVMGSVIVVGGIAAIITNKIGVDVEWIVLVGGIGLLFQLVKFPNGIASQFDPRSRHRTGRAAERAAAKQAKRDAKKPHRSTAEELGLDGEITTEPIAPATLTVDGLTVRIGSIYPVNNVGLEVRTGEVLGLIGPNGAGKTTFIDAVTGFVKPIRGSVLLDGTDITKWPAARRTRRGLSRTFQSLELFEDLTVRDNILAGADGFGGLPYLTDAFWPREHKLPPEALRAIRDLELVDLLDLEVSELPYGKRRLVSIARALAGRPSILMLDEPGAGLSDVESTELRHLIRRLADDWGLGILLVEHDMSIVMAVCDRIVALESGMKIADDTPDVIVHDERVRASYLGDYVVAADGGAEQQA